MAATFVIFLREGIEASMIVAILLASLDRLGQRRHFRDVLAGVVAALVLVAVGGVVAYVTIKTYAGSRGQTIFETATYLLAAAVLTYMTFWMRRPRPPLGRPAGAGPGRPRRPRSLGPGASGLSGRRAGRARDDGVHTGHRVRLDHDPRRSGRWCTPDWRWRC